METAASLLARLKGISKPQRKFLITLFTSMLIARGKLNFRNLSRYSEVSEKTYSRQFARPFGFVAFNREVINEAIGTESERIIAFDPSFVPKSGKKTYGLDYFWNGCHNRPEKGLEVSSVAIVDIERKMGFALSVRQTLPPQDAQQAGETLPKEESKTVSVSKDKPKKHRRKYEEDDETLIDQYVQQLREVRPFLLPNEKHVAVDGSFGKRKYVDGVCALDLHVIGKLRCDANMRFLYTGPKREKGSGRQKTYDGKVHWQDLARFEYVGEEDGIALYTQILNHVTLKRNVRVVVLLDTRNKEHLRYAILFSTDTSLDAKKIFQYYKARFQIEFIFRDAKQFTGLCDCQARDQAKLDFHFNAALTTLNLAKLEHLQAYPDADPTAFSMASVKACYFNEYFLQKIFSMFALDQSLMKKSPEYEELRNFGKIRA
jgi:hypothetical protein